MSVPSKSKVEVKVEVRGSQGGSGSSRYHFQSHGRGDTFSWP